LTNSGTLQKNGKVEKIINIVNSLFTKITLIDVDAPFTSFNINKIEI